MAHRWGHKGRHLAVGSWMRATGADSSRWPEWAQEATTADQSSWWEDLRELLKYRITDRFVRLYGKQLHHERLGAAGCRAQGGSSQRKCPWPGGLSVSADWIAVTTFRAAALLQQANKTDRLGNQGVYEVYPAAALAQWHLYKDERGKRCSDHDVANEVVSQLTTGLKSRDVETDLKVLGAQMINSGHIRDAVVAAIATWAAVIGKTYSCAEANADSDFWTASLGVGKHRRSSEAGRQSRLQTLLGAAAPSVNQTIAREGWIHHPMDDIAAIVATDPLNHTRQSGCGASRGP